MAEIAPFRGITYHPRIPPSEVLAPPYDVIDERGRAELAAKHEKNCVRLILPEAPAGSGEPGGPDKYQHAADTLSAWLADETLVRDDRPAIYRYHQVFQSAELGEQRVTRRGFIAAVRLHAFDEGVILPHERTLKGPKIDRLALMEATRCHFSQIFTMYADPSGQTDRLFARFEARRPALEGTTDDGTVHQVWRVHDREAIGALQRLLGPLKLYIADGHHRYETMLALRERMRERAGGQLSHNSAAQFGTMFLANMNDPGLVVLPTHRLIHGLHGFAPEDLIEAAREYFDITTVEEGALVAPRLRAALAEASARRPSFAAIWPFNEDAALFSLKSGISPAAVGLEGHPALTSLDVSLLHGLVLERLLGIDRAAQEAQTHIEYIKDTQKALDRVAECKGQICFIMNPTRVDQVKAVSDAHEVMPQKSTFFYPKIASGVVFHPIDPDEELS